MVDESELCLFIESIQKLHLIPVDFQKVPEIQSLNTREFCISFRFVTTNDFLMGRSEIMAIGLVKRIIINN